MKIIEREKFYVVGMIKTIEEHKLNIEMPKLFKMVNERKFEISNRLSNQINDITIKRSGNIYQQMVGYVVRQIDNVPKEMTLLTIPTQKYIYYKHVGPSYMIYDAFVSMYDFALENQITLDDSEFKIEVYNDELSEYDLYIKLK